MRDPMVALKEHYDELIKRGYREESILGIFCYGSQNYDFAHQNSDVDTKAIIIPSFRDLCLNSPISKEIHFENGEHCEVKDIREIVSMFKKQNVNFLEILFTDFKIINPKYVQAWDKYFVSYNERIAHYNDRKALLSICGQAMHALKHFKSESDGKKYANAMRLYLFLQDYIKNIPYKDAIRLRDEKVKTELLQYKLGEKIVPVEKATILYEKFEKLRDEVLLMEEKRDIAIEEHMNDAIVKMFREN